jgi:lipoate---protein ligase
MDMLLEQPVTIDNRVNLATDEALLRAAPAAPAMRVWVGSRCVVVGRGQRVSREVDTAACARDGVPVYRRSSGGGAVYHDTGNLNLTLLWPGWRPSVKDDLADLVAAVLSSLGLRPQRDARGVHVDGAKVSGLACQVTSTGSLAHASLLVTTPPDRIATYLSPAPDDPRPLDSVRAPVRPLAAHLPGIDLSTVGATVTDVLTLRHGPTTSRPPRPAELHWRDRLLAERYLHLSWHLTGTSRETATSKETSWTTRPALSSTA